MNRPAPKLGHITNRRGVKVTQLCFASVEDLEVFFIEELIGSDLMAGSASKAIGKTLLIWEK